MGQHGSRERRHPDVNRHDLDHGASTETGLRYGCSGIQGYRATMEDSHCAEISVLDSEGTTGIFGVFDGHGGSSAAKFIASHFVKHMKAMFEEEVPDEDNPEYPQLVAEAIQNAFRRLDESLRFFTASDERRAEMDAGCTATTAFVTKQHVIFANLGDSRALFCRQGQPLFSTVDHKPDDEEEQARIRKAGGFVTGGRVCAVLAVSRAFGDFALKEVEGLSQDDQMVSCVPTVHVFKRTPEADEFIALACDGVWDVLINSTVAEFVKKNALQFESKLSDLAHALNESALHRGSTDNISSMVILFPAMKTSREVDDMIDDMFSLGGLDDSTRAEIEAETQAAKSAQTNPQPELEPTEKELAQLERLATNRKSKRRARPTVQQVFQLADDSFGGDADA
eukprot:m.288428 g.288428  ORF g.288428 m.288428 type:complete len:396 (+) comp15803_c0_seq2:184-1371(+)